MQTPRFSGHPCSAGDFVLVRTFWRPLRTSCANVGTALPHTSKSLVPFPGWLSPARGFRGWSTERVSSDPGGPILHAQNPLRLAWQRVKRRGLLGFAGLAPHSGRSPSSVPYKLPEQETFPFYHRAKIPLIKR